MKAIPYSTQWIDRSDIDAVAGVLRRDWITQGPKIKEFEDSLAAYCGSRYAVVVSNGTAALHIACLAAGIKGGDEVITSPVTFVASANCVAYCGGRPVFADIEPDTANISPEETRRKTTKKTKAVIPVHFAGHPCDLDGIKRAANKHNLIVIEDAAHALGARYKNSKIGSCAYSDMAVFSFHPVKAITTGEGGAVLTNNKKLYERCLSFRNHGITRDKGRMAKCDGPWHYEMTELGFNYRLTDFQCALGLRQLEKIESFIERRRAIANRYNEAFRGIEWLKTPVERPGSVSAFHLYVLRVDFKQIKKNRKDAAEFLRANNIITQVHYYPVHLQPYYQKTFGYKKGDFTAAEAYYEEALSIPIFPKMSDTDARHVIKNIKRLEA